MSGLLLSLWLAVQIDGAGGCPTAAEIQAQLGPLLPPGAGIDALRSGADRREPGWVGHRAGPGRRKDGCAPAPAARRNLRRAGRNRGGDARRLGGADSPGDLAAAGSPRPGPRPGRRSCAAPRTDAEPAPTLARTAAARAGCAPAPGRRSAPPPSVRGNRGSVAAGGAHRRHAGRGGRAAGARGSRSQRLANHACACLPGEATWWRAYLAAVAPMSVLPVGARWQLTAGRGRRAGRHDRPPAPASRTDRTTRSVDVGVEALVRVELRPGIRQALAGRSRCSPGCGGRTWR